MMRRFRLVTLFGVLFGGACAGGVQSPREDHEEAFTRLIRQTPAGYLVVDTPWTEIDFPEDLARAEDLIHAMEMHR